MKIQSCQNNINITTTSNETRKTNYALSSNNFDSFQKNSTSNISFKKGFFASLFNIKKTNEALDRKIINPSTYAEELSVGISDFFEKEIPPENLKSIMSPNEFREILKNLKRENFISYNKENRDKGIYCIDLDYHTNFSNGKEDVFDILDNVVKYADKYAKKTGKPFIFSITDRDSLEGVKHVVRLIGENPERYKNVKFLPGIKMTFAHKAPTSKIGFENSEMLVYGINPFSENLNNLIDNTIKKRREMVISFIREVNKLYPEFAYTVIEFAEQNRLHLNKDFTVSNLYWRAREYAESKGELAIKDIKLPPKEIMKQSEIIINQLPAIYTGSDSYINPLPSINIAENSALNKEIRDVFTKFSTHHDKEQGKVISSAENLYEEMIDCLSKEPYKPEMALCAPYYLSHHFGEKEQETFPKVVEFIKELQANSNEMLNAIETIVPSYNLDKESGISREIILKFNDYVKKNIDIYEVGGSFAQRNNNSLIGIS